jgi:hypothetical protein
MHSRGHQLSGARETITCREFHVCVQLRVMTARRRPVGDRTGVDGVGATRDDPGIVTPADDSTPDWLSRNARLLLIGFGFVLIAGSVVVPHRQEVAPVFATLGILVAVFGVLLSLIEGPFQIGPGGLSAKSKQLQRTAGREDLDTEQKGDLLTRQLGVDAGQPDRAAARTTWSQLIQTLDTVRSDGSTAPDWPTGEPPALPTVREFIVTGDVENPVRWAYAFETHVRQAFVEDGWEVTRRPDVGVEPDVDFIAEKDGWMVRVEVLLRRRMTASDMRRAIAQFGPDARAPRTLGLIVVNSGAPNAGGA